MEMKNSIEKIISAAPSTRGNGDYMVDDILYCGQCHTPKQMWLDFLGETRLVNCLCSCQNDEYESQRSREKLRQRINSIKACNPDYHTIANKTFKNWAPDINQDLQKIIIRFFMGVVKGTYTSGLCLSGTVGSGKSYAAACLFNAFLSGGMSIRWRRFSDLIAMGSDYSCDFSREIKNLARAKVVILDDFGAQRETSYASECAFRIMDELSLSECILIVTTNLTEDMLKNPKSTERSRIYSRLLGKPHLLKVEGEDLRGLK